MTSRLWRRRARPVVLAAAASAVLAAGTLGATDPVATAAEPAARDTSAASLATLPLAGLLAGTAALGTTASGTAAAAAVRGTAAAAATPSAAGDPSYPSGIPTRPYTDCVNTTGVPYATGLPPLPCLLFSYQTPGTSGAVSAYSDSGALFADITQNAVKTATLINLPETVSRVFQIICTVPTGARPCPTEFGFDYPTDPAYLASWIGVGAYVFVQSPVDDRGTSLDPSQPQYSVVTQLRVPVLAFGSIPGAATLTVQQPLVDGYAQPIRLTIPSFSQTYPEGTKIPGYERFGANPYPTAQLYGDASGVGDVDITVSDVTIDGVALDVGSTCRTSTTLDLFGQGGWVETSEGGIPKPVPNEPGEYQPFNTPSYLHAQVDVPAFSGCVGGSGEDVSPLITGLISAPGNALDLTQVVNFKAFGCLTSAKPNCSSQHPAVAPPSKVIDRTDG